MRVIVGVMGDGRVISSMVLLQRTQIITPFFALHHTIPPYKDNHIHIATMEDIMTITPLGSGQGEKKH